MSVPLLFLTRRYHLNLYTFDGFIVVGNLDALVFGSFVLPRTTHSKMFPFGFLDAITFLCNHR